LQDYRLLPLEDRRIRLSIARLNKVKENLLASENQFRLANDKAEDLSIKKLTKNSPLLKEQFKGLNS
jgi:hypothetical protein